MTEVFGDFIAIQNCHQEYLRINFSPTSVPLQQRWRNNGLSADFLADYLSTFFPTDNPQALDRQNDLKSAVSYIANELLENAMKFTYAPAQHPITITMQLDEDSVRFYVTNRINPQVLAGFKNYIQQLLTQDPQELYLQQMQSNSDSHEDENSNLGYLTMLNDYHARLAWKFEIPADDAQAPEVTTMVQVPV